MSRLNTERQERLEPHRHKIAVNELKKLGYQVFEYHKSITFYYKGKLITYFPYTGWATGKGIENGRGLQHLLNQIKP